MRLILKNKAYDTEKARVVGEWVDFDPRGPSRITERLYRKRTGELFLYGTGDPYARQSSLPGRAEWRGSEWIQPLDYDLGREWAEEHLEPAAYEAAFGVPADGERTVLCLSVSTRVDRLLERQCSYTGETKSAVVERLVIEYLS